MSILSVEVEPLAVDVSFPNDCLHVRLADAREITVPLTWFPRLKNATAKQRKQWRLIGGGMGIRWEELDKDVSVESLLRLR